MLEDGQQLLRMRKNIETVVVVAAVVAVVVVVVVVLSQMKNYSFLFANLERSKKPKKNNFLSHEHFHFFATLF